MTFQTESAYSRSLYSTSILFIKPLPPLISNSNGSGNVTGLKFESRTHTQSRTRTHI